MSEKQFSLFELHFHDSVQFGPKTIGGLSRNDEEEGEETPAGLPSADEPPALEEEPIAGDEGDESGPCLGCRLVGLGVLAAAAYAVRKLLGGEPSGLDALDDIEAEAEGSSADGNEESVSIEVTSGEEPESDRTGLAVAAVAALLVLLAFVTRKLLGDSVEGIEAPEELAEE